MYKINEEFCEFYGILIGDGCISKYDYRNKTHFEIRIDGNSITDKEYYNYIVKLIKSITERDVKIRKRKKGNSIYITFHCKDLANFLNNELNFPFGKKKNLAISNKITSNPRLLKKVLRGLFDTDGCIYFTQNNKKDYYYPIIEISSHNNSLLEQLSKSLESLGFFYKFSFYKDSVKLHGKKNLKRWMNNIYSSHPEKLARYRTWKEKGYCFPQYISGKNEPVAQPG